MHLGVRVEIDLERAEATHDVLRGVGAIDAQDHLLGPALRKHAACCEHGFALRKLVDSIALEGCCELPEFVMLVLAHAYEASGDEVLLQIRYRFNGQLSAAARAVLDPERLTWV